MSNFSLTWRNEKYTCLHIFRIDQIDFNSDKILLKFTAKHESVKRLSNFYSNMDNKSVLTSVSIPSSDKHV